jgi:serine/threonine-protein kinase
LASLKQRVKARPASQPEHEKKIKFQREAHQTALNEKVRLLLISACGTDLPLECAVSHFEGHWVASFQFDCSRTIRIIVQMMLQWQEGLYSTMANVLLAGRIISAEMDPDLGSNTFKIVNTTTIEPGGETNATAIVEDISVLVAEGLTLFDSINAVGGDIEELKNKDLGSRDTTHEQ